MNDRLNNIAVRWDKIEYRIKQVELLSRDVRIPAINELRYAGRQLIDALVVMRTPSVEPEIIAIRLAEHIVVAEQYVRNADHDISDAVIDFLKGRIDRAVSIYGLHNLVQHFPLIGEMRQRLSQCDTLIQESRADRTLRDRNYDILYNDYIVRMLELFDEFKRAEPAVIYDSLVIERKYKISLVFNVIAGIASILGLVLGILFYIYPLSDIKNFTCTTVGVGCVQKNAGNSQSDIPRAPAAAVVVSPSNTNVPVG